MSTYQTEFSLICRTIANTTRLQLLWEVFNGEELSVQDLAIQAGTSKQNASNQLRALAAKEFIRPYRGKREVFYKPARPSAECVRQLLPILRKCHAQSLPSQAIIHQATAFTHERRIQIVRCLTASDETFESLLKRTGMTAPSQSRHLRKLLRRNVIHKQNKAYQLSHPDSKLAQCLLKLAAKAD